MLLALNVTYWYAWAALVPGILWLARRYRFGRNTWMPAAAAHTLGVLVFTFLHALLTVTCRLPIAAIFGADAPARAGGRRSRSCSSSISTGR